MQTHDATRTVRCNRKVDYMLKMYYIFGF